MGKTTIKYACVMMAALVLGSGCSDDKAPTSPYAEDISAAKQSASSDFERKVFEDSDISTAEYQEAIQRFIDCIKSRGLDAAAVDQDGYYVYSISKTNQAAADEAQSECRAGTVELIEPIYVDRLRNPNKEDYFAVVLRCVKRKALVTDDYTLEKLNEDQRTRFENAPFDGEDPRLQECLSNPQN